MSGEAARVPAHLEVSGLIRRVAAAGGFAAVLQKGERDAGTILLILREQGVNPRIFERMPHVDGTRPWTALTKNDFENTREFDAYLARRGRSDPDLWLIELDVPNPERFISESGTRD